MSDKLNIEELFSSKIGEGELIPSPGAWKGIQRKLRWEKFLRFHPGQFNVFYLGAMVVAGVGLIALLTLRNTEATTEIRTEEAQIQQQDTDPEQIEDTGSSAKSSTGVASANENSGVEVTGSATEKIVSSDSETDQTGEPIKAEASDSETDSGPAKPDLKTNNEIEDSRGVIQLTPAVVIPASSNQVAHFTTSLQSGCVPLTVQFQNHSVNGVAFKWSFGNDARSTLADPIHTFTEPDEYSVTLTAEYADGQTAVHQQIIQVYPLPVADFQVEEGFAGNDGHVALVLANYSSGATDYKWNLLDKSNAVNGSWSSEEFQPNLKLSDLSEGSEHLQLVITSYFGCEATAIQELPVKMESSDVKMKFATAFSPNPTGPGGGSFSPHEKRRDVFHPIFFEVPIEYSLKIYTKRGALVFDTREIYQGWDGYFHEERSAGGVYVWMVEGTWATGETFTLQGDVTLIWQDIW